MRLYTIETEATEGMKFNVAQGILDLMKFTYCRLMTRFACQKRFGEALMDEIHMLCRPLHFITDEFDSDFYYVSPAVFYIYPIR